MIPKPYKSVSPVIESSLPSTSSNSPSTVARSVKASTMEIEEISFSIPSKTYAQGNILKPAIFFEETGKENVEKSISPTVSPASKRWLMDVIDMPEDSPKKYKKKLILDESDTPQKKKMKLTIENQKRLLKNKRSTISRLRLKIKGKIQNATLTNIIGNVKFVSKPSQVLTQMQVLHKKKLTVE